MTAITSTLHFLTSTKVTWPTVRIACVHVTSPCVALHTACIEVIVLLRTFAHMASVPEDQLQNLIGSTFVPEVLPCLAARRLVQLFIRAEP
jgi:hypothetical protein